MTNDELIEIALSVGFEKSDGTGLSGNSDLDELLYVGEYAVGEQLLEFANIIQAKLAPETPECVAEVVILNEPEWMKPHEGIKWRKTDFKLGTKFYTNQP